MTDDPPAVTPRDIFLARELSEDAAARFLASRGFRAAATADQHLQQLADDLPTRLALGELADVLFDTLGAAPDPDAALVGFCCYVATRTPKSSFLGYLHDDPRALEILTHLLGASPFLSEILIRNPEYFHWLQHRLDRPPPDLVDYRAELDGLRAQNLGRERQLDALKRFQPREMLRIAGRDLLGKDTLRSATEQLSNLADTVTDDVLRLVTMELTADTGPLPGTVVIIGMGKLGGRELNYSSDIDLIYVYEPDDADDPDAHTRFQKLGRRLTAVLGEHTAEGYFYRVDLRLRPMGQRGNVVYSLRQIEHYYESWGETFERFALIKARPVAGDLVLGARFVEMVRPFVYRKYLDHAAIEELARYKARSDREHARREATDRNVKVGRGGIREIELFIQVFQLIYGGERTDLQDGNTLAALAQLEPHGFIDETVHADLRHAYEFLRTVEHRLQIVQDSHTHSLKNSEAELEVSARRTGFGTATELMAELDRHRERVHAVYTSLLEQRGDDAGLDGRRLFRLLAGEMTDPDAIAHLRSGGLRDPDGALQAIRALDDVPSHAHSRSATRNLLANLLATVLDDVAHSGAPTKVLNRFEHVVVHSGAAASLYRSLLENEPLRKRLLLALDTGDLFAQRLARHPELLDFLVAASLEPDAFASAVRTAFDRVDGTDLAACMDPFRRVKAIEEFKVLVEWLTLGSLETLTHKLSQVADAAIESATRRAAHESARPDPERWVVVALRKLGGRELTVHSDLDLVFLYAGDPGDAPRFHRQQKFVRAVHDFLAKPTAEGSAYQLDTRLRPEGTKGALAVPVVAFRRYLDERAEIWERMAWTRSRFITGDTELATDVEAAVADFVYGPWQAEIPGYARRIRSRMERELAKETAGGRLDLKLGHGGLADIDFLVQVLQLREGPTRAEFRVAGTRQLLTSLPDTRFLDRVEVDQLRVSYEFLRELETMLRIDADSSIGWISTNAAELEPLARRLRHEPLTGEALLGRYREVTTGVRSVYEDVMKRLEK